MSPITTIKLPLPPSSNRYWRSAPGKGMVPTKDAQHYKTTVARICQLERVPCVTGRYEMKVAIFGARADADLGNFLKVLEDALELHAFINDKHARRIVLDRVEGGTGKGAMVTIEGLQVASASDVQQARLAKLERNRKRKATIAKNRAAKFFSKLRSAVRR